MKYISAEYITALTLNTFWLVWPLHRGTHLEDRFLLRCFQQLSLPYIATQRLLKNKNSLKITGTPEVCLFWSSRTKKRSSQSLTPTPDMDRTVSRRSEPSSRAAFMGEQPNPWDVLPPQDATSRHRGAKPPRRYGLLGEISLLSLE